MAPAGDKAVGPEIAATEAIAVPFCEVLIVFQRFSDLRQVKVEGNVAGNLDLAALSLDERTRGALEAFEMAVRPFGLAANGHDGQQVRERSLRLLEKDCKALVTAAEALVAAVAYLVECPLLVMLLQKLPRLLCRQALMIGLADVTPELVDRECLKTQARSGRPTDLDSPLPPVLAVAWALRPATCLCAFLLRALHEAGFLACDRSAQAQRPHTFHLWSWSGIAYHGVSLLAAIRQVSAHHCLQTQTVFL